jgi:DDE superfamily endonuclease
VVRFTNNVVVSLDFWYKEVKLPKKPGKERKPLCQVHFQLVVTSPTISCKTHSTPFVDEPRRYKSFNAFGWRCSFMNSPACGTRTLPKRWACPFGRCNVGAVAGLLAISPSKTILGAVASPLFPPLDQAMIHAMACETIAATQEPLSRQSLADLVRRSRETLGKKISRSTVWRMLHEAAIKPWQYEHWLFPKDPRFAEKAGPILDLYAGLWEGQPLGAKDYVLSMDEKTSIQARGRSHEEMAPEPKQTRRIEAEYERNGALQYLAAWDVHRGMILGRCEKKTGIKPFGLLVDQVLEQAPYEQATRLFFIVDNGSSHRGKASVERLRRRDKRILLVHTPIHASWLNQVEIYFSIIQRKVLTPNDFATLEAVRVRLALYEELSNRTPRPFAWKFTRQDMLDWLKRASPHFLAASAA